MEHGRGHIWSVIHGEKTFRHSLEGRRPRGLQVTNGSEERAPNLPSAFFVAITHSDSRTAYSPRWSLNVDTKDQLEAPRFVHLVEALEYPIQLCGHRCSQSW